MNSVSETLTAEFIERSRVLWDRLVLSCRDGSLPFVKFDPLRPGVIASAWDVIESGDETDDVMRGLFYADLLLHLAKTRRDVCEPFRVISEVLQAVAQKGAPGPIERGFLDRISMFAVAGSLN